MNLTINIALNAQMLMFALNVMTTVYPVVFSSEKIIKDA